MRKKSIENIVKIITQSIMPNIKAMEGGKKGKKGKKPSGHNSPMTGAEVKGMTMAQIMNYREAERKKAGNGNSNASNSGSVRSSYSPAGTTRILKKVKRTPGKKGTKK